MKFENDEEFTKNAETVFLKLRAGETARGILRGDVLKTKTHFNNGKSENCLEPAPCGACKMGIKVSRRFRVNFFSRPEGKWETKIYEGPVGVYKQLKDLSEAGWDLSKSLVEIKREGDGMNTKWKVTMLPTPLTAERLSELEKLPLLPLTIQPKSAEATEDNIPF